LPIHPLAKVWFQCGKGLIEATPLTALRGNIE
jgi:hypothetical protein